MADLTGLQKQELCLRFAYALSTFVHECAYLIFRIVHTSSIRHDGLDLCVI